MMIGRKDMEHRRNIIIIIIAAILAIGLTLYGEKKDIEKADNKDVKNSSQIYLETNTSSIQSE